jgi:shikimate kinase
LEPLEKGPTVNHLRSGVHVVLLGLRGAGKSMVGGLLAAQLGAKLVDLDRVTLDVLGRDAVTRAWREVGEEGFRRAEVQALGRVLAGDGGVIALGGGTPTAPGAAAMLREAQAQGRAVLVYLRSEPTMLQRRLTAAGAGDRPALLGDDPIGEIAAIFAARDPLYSELADHVVDAAPQAADVAKEIVRLVARPT